ncbi:hypothetical protein [Kitasatospora sp. NPDC093558]|uniref:hypothetical protein n=1 Tax=Kitasatospora sp. NPDC093558 TaxID=3155201 RepID=UPI0034473D6B
MRSDVTPATATACTVVPITLVLVLIAWIYPVVHQQHHRHVLAPKPAPTTAPTTR